MVFGDGDGQVFQRFTKSLSVIGHELAHGVADYSAGLVYRNQAGALNESMSDVFGALVEQYVQQQPAAAAGWLIGEGLFTDQVQGNALRSLKAPGTAYDDDIVGKDPQPDSIDDGYVSHERRQQQHPHKLRDAQPRLYLVATTVGGNAWGCAGTDLVQDPGRTAHTSQPQRSAHLRETSCPRPPKSSSVRTPRSNKAPCAPRGKLLKVKFQGAPRGDPARDNPRPVKFTTS